MTYYFSIMREGQPNVEDLQRKQMQPGQKTNKQKNSRLEDADPHID